jgi:hypothetical protein
MINLFSCHDSSDSLNTRTINTGSELPQVSHYPLLKKREEGSTFVPLYVHLNDQVEQVIQVITPNTCIWKVLSLNLSQDIGYPDLGFLESSSVPPDRCQGSISDDDCFLPNPFQFIIL